MKLNGSQMVCESLVAEGVRTVFGLPGGAIMPLYDALPSYPINHVLVRHEQGAAHMADGFGRASGDVGVCMATSGPGAINLVVGLANAMMDSAPMVAITANVATAAIGTDAFQEADITGISIPVTKHNFLVRDVKDLPTVMKQAFHLARSGRPGPVLVDIPKDVLQAEAEFSYPTKISMPSYNPTTQPNTQQVRKAARLIENSQRPVIIAGHGVLISKAWPELRELAEKSQIPVVNTLLGLSNFPGDHPLYLGMMGMHGTAYASYAVDQSDLVLGIGIRFDDRAMGKYSTFAPHAKVVHIDIDPAEIGKNVRTDVPIVADCKAALQALNREIGECQSHAAWLNQVDEWREQYPLPKPAAGSALSHRHVIDEIWRSCGGKAIISTDVGQHQMFMAQQYPFLTPNSHFSSGGLGTMGFSLPAGIGAAFARPDELVWCCAGDGGFQMTLQELAVVRNFNLNMKIALFNNTFLGMVRQWQQLFYKENYVEVSLAGPPDFIKLADAYDIPARRVESPGEVADAVRWASEIKGPAFLEFQIDPKENVFPMVIPGTSLAEVIPFETHTRGNNGQQPVHVQSGHQPVSLPGIRD
ncbi:MAG: acetolactate synthase large subunit [Chloroflexota bacterium]|jgi:acetolactate synthase-1/2/3 large subunit|nr:acetolactate synthase large subunit [Chloroflexota bacterium]